MAIGQSMHREASSGPPPERSGGWFLGGHSLLRLALTLLLAISMLAYGEDTRKLKSGAPPAYPDLARKLNIRGIARVMVTVAPDGAVTEVKEKGGNPVLVDALVRAVKKWRYEPADKTSTIEVQYTFTSE